MAKVLIGAHTRWKSRYHFVWGVKYRHQVITLPVASHLKKTVIGISERYEYIFDSLGTDGDHVHLLIGAHPKQSPAVIIKTVKSITARMIFKKFPSLKKLLWGGSLWAIGYYFETVGDGKPENVMRDYVTNQGTNEEKNLIKQLRLI